MRDASFRIRDRRPKQLFLANPESRISYHDFWTRHPRQINCVTFQGLTPQKAIVETPLVGVCNTQCRGSIHRTRETDAGGINVAPTIKNGAGTRDPRYINCVTFQGLTPIE